MYKMWHIAWLLMRVQLSNFGTFFFWVALPVVFTYILAQQGGTGAAKSLPLFSLISAGHGELAVALSSSSNIDELAHKAMYARSTSGMMVMFTFIFMLSSASSLIWERDQGTLRRLEVMPLGRHQILLGKLLGVYSMGVFQLLVLASCNILMFGLAATVNPLGLLLMILTFGFCSAGLGMLVAAVARTTEQASALTLVLVICISALGGAWWPLDLVPDFMQTLAKATPTFWALDGFYQSMHQGAAPWQIAGTLATLLGFGGLFLALGLYRFRF